MADLDFKKLDSRLVQRYLRKGLLDPREYDNYLKTLPDVAEKATTIESAFEPSGEPQPGTAAQPETGDSEG